MTIKITIAYATPEQQVELPLNIEESCTVAIAIKRSGLLERFPEINLATAVIGVFSKKVALDSLLTSGDRIEIYRPLLLDPKAARRLRSQHRY